MIQIKEGQSLWLAVALASAFKHAGAVQEGSERFVCSDESIVRITPDPANPQRVKVTGLDGSSNATALVEYRADADRGEGVREIVIPVSIVVTQGDAVGGSLAPEGEAFDDFETLADPAKGVDANATGSGLSGTGTVGAAANPNNIDPVDRIKGDGTPGSGSRPAGGSGAPDGSVTSPTAEAEKTGDAAKPVDTGNAPPDAGTTTEGMTFPEAAEKAKESTEGDAGAKVEGTSAETSANVTDGEARDPGIMVSDRADTPSVDNADKPPENG